MAVPESWSTGATRCGAATEATVWFPGVVDVDCPNPPHGFVPQLKIGSLSTPLGSRMFDHTTPTESTLPDGTEVTETPVRCLDSFPESCSFQVAVPSEDVFFIVTIPDMKQHVLAQSMLDSLRTVPRGFTTVPWIEPGTPHAIAIASLSGSGLEASVGNASSLAPIDGTAPAAGSVVEEGSTVSLIGEGQTGLTESRTAVAAGVVEAYRRDNPSAYIGSAYARWERGTVAQPNVGTCESGELLLVTMFGSFPSITTSQPPGGDGTDGEVTRVVLTADAQTAEVCLLAVGTGSSPPDVRDTWVWGAQTPVEPSTDPTVVLDGAEPVNDLADVIGSWHLISGELGMSINRSGKHYSQSFPLACNSGSQPLRLDVDGVVRVGASLSTTMGCAEDSDYPRAHPLVDGQRLFLSPDGQLLALASDGSVAAYVRSAP